MLTLGVSRKVTAAGGGGGGGLAAVGSPVIGTSGSFGSTCTMSVTPSGANSVIIVTVAWQTHGAVPSSVVFNTSENFTLIGSDTSVGAQSFAAYALFSPTATTANVVVTFGGTGFSTAVAQCVSGAASTTGWVTSLANTGSAISHSIGSVAAGEWVFDVVSISDADSAGTQGANQTLLAAQGRGVASGAGGMGSSYNSTSTGTVAMTWTPGFVVNWAAGAFRLVPA